jgi:hypothetical protein
MLYTIVAKDMYKNKPLHEDMQFNIRQCVSNSNNNNLYPFLKLYIRHEGHVHTKFIF